MNTYTEHLDTSVDRRCCLNLESEAYVFHTDNNDISMEPTSLALSALGLAGLFTNAIDCFKCFQIAKEYERDFVNTQLQLDLAGIQLSRWGKAVGLSDGTHGDEFSPTCLGSGSEVAVAKSALQQILGLFESARRKSIELSQTPATRERVCNALTTSMDTEIEATNVPNEIAKILEMQKSKTPLLAKSKWALYGKKELESLVNSIVKLVDKLVELFPRAQEMQIKLNRIESEQITGNDNVASAASRAQDQDRTSAGALEEDPSEGGGHVYEQFSIEGNEEVLAGDVVDSGYYGKLTTPSKHQYHGFTIVNSRVVTIGNRFRKA